MIVKQDTWLVFSILILIINFSLFFLIAQSEHVMRIRHFQTVSIYLNAPNSEILKQLPKENNYPSFETKYDTSFAISLVDAFAKSFLLSIIIPFFISSGISAVTRNRNPSFRYKIFLLFSVVLLLLGLRTSLEGIADG